MASMKLYETFANEYMRDIIKMIVAHHKDYNIPLYYLSQNYNVTWEIIQENPDINWDYSYLSENNFTKMRLEFIHEKIKEYFIQI